MKNDVKNAICPECGELISIDAALSGHIKAKLSKDFEEKERILRISLEKDSQAVLAKKESELMKRVKDSLEKESMYEKKNMNDRLAEMSVKLKQANQNELEIRKEKQKLKDEKDSFELEKTRQLDRERGKIADAAARNAYEAQQSKIDQLDKQLKDAKKINIEQARRLEQGSQQTQGEVQEIILEDLLRTEFTHDDILPVPKGVNGADIIQIVKTHNGIECGKIIWESKKTKTWTEGWVQKLKDDQRLAKADLAVIVSSVLPKGVEGISEREGVYVCDIKLATAVASLLRQSLEAVSRMKALSVGKDEKMKILFNYLTGTGFTQRINAIREAFFSMSDSLKKERNIFEKNWSDREKQIQKVIKNTAGIYVDLNGIVQLQKIDFLGLPESSSGIDL